MQLISLSANMSSFHTVQFKSGLNIIVGNQAEQSSEDNTFNGVGKSLLIHLIHFCLGSSKIDSLAENLSGWVFTLVFSLEGAEYVCERAVDEQNKIILNQKSYTLNKFCAFMEDLLFSDLSMIKSVSFRSLITRFLRRYRSSYTSYQSYISQEPDYAMLINNSFLLDLDINLIQKKKELRDLEKNSESLYKAMNKDSHFRDSYLGTDMELTKSEHEYQVKELKEKIDSFKIAEEYHQIEVETADKCREKKSLEFRRTMLSNRIVAINKSLEQKASTSEESVCDVYKAASIEIPDMIKKSVEEVLVFHQSMLETREKRLDAELSHTTEDLVKIDLEIKQIGQEIDKFLIYLDTHGALDEYTSLSAKLSSHQEELAKIVHYEDIITTTKKQKSALKKEYADQDLKMEQYLVDNHDKIEQIKSTFRDYAKKFYPNKKSGLSITNNTGDNQLRCNIEAKIDDDASDGVSDVKIFCFDLLLLFCETSSVRFLVHDNRLFANMDPRQRKTLFVLIDKVCTEQDYQYICSVNEDNIESFRELMEENEYKRILEDNVILRLKDDSPESKLLGIEVDIELDKNQKSPSKKK